MKSTKGKHVTGFGNGGSRCVSSHGLRVLCGLFCVGSWAAFLDSVWGRAMMRLTVLQSVARADFLPGQVTVTWRASWVVSVKLGRARGRPVSEKRLARKLLKALDKGAKAAGFQIEIEGVPEFSRKVLRAVSRIARGRVRTYAEIARAVGRPGAARAVGQALARNPVPVLVPCHRVVKSGGYLGGFAGGRLWREFLLSREGWEFCGKGRNRRLACRSDCPGSG